MNTDLSKIDAFLQGGFFRWITTAQTGGSAGTLKITDRGISWKTAFMNFGGAFTHSLDEIRSVSRAKYLNFLVFPTSCLQITFTNGKCYKFTFKFIGGSKGQVEQDVVAFLRSKGVKVEL
jgi:hypothetical protein